MSNRFSGVGNLGVAPTLKPVEVRGETRMVAEMRIYFDRLVPDGDGGWKDKGGFWMDVAWWGKKAERAVPLLPKGARVEVSGVLVQESWNDKEDKEQTRLRVTADRVSLDMGRVEHIEFRKRSEAPADDPDLDDDIPF